MKKKIRSLEDLNRFREKAFEAKQRQTHLGNVQVIVSLGSCGIAAGAFDTLKAIQQQVDDDHLNEVIVSQTGCIGLCGHEPIVEVITADTSKVTYGHVTPEVARRILREHVLGGKVLEAFVVEV
ncbi:MAG: (2Fe-2S) ferredoxin domain-containing protein [Anaerolineae bacterium]|nr:MAG: (2Fe-2S) ferredoxin domain-containing protein [Anaerolineae bacterium]